MLNSLILFLMTTILSLALFDIIHTVVAALSIVAISIAYVFSGDSLPSNEGLGLAWKGKVNKQNLLRLNQFLKICFFGVVIALLLKEGGYLSFGR